MSRAKQPENRRIKHHNQGTAQEKPWLNSEGYHDLTAYLALRNIERRERVKQMAR